eukprot:Hpha_TRINITY_DN16795_c1_g4::TRINITY_DN16795_c1_g4_i1::g.78221::m.78221
MSVNTTIRSLGPWLPVDIQTKKVIEEVERATQGRVKDLKFLWNLGNVLITLEILEDEDAKKEKCPMPCKPLTLWALQAADGKCPRLAMSLNTELNQPGPSVFVNLRIFPLAEERTDRDKYLQEKQTWMTRFRREVMSKEWNISTVWCEEDLNGLFSVAALGSIEAEVDFTSFHVPWGAFGHAEKAGRLYGQVYLQFSSIEKAAKYFAADGMRCCLRGLDCVARVEGLTKKQVDKVAPRHQWCHPRGPILPLHPAGPGGPPVLVGDEESESRPLPPLVSCMEKGGARISAAQLEKSPVVRVRQPSSPQKPLAVRSPQKSPAVINPFTPTPVPPMVFPMWTTMRA